MVGLDGIDTCSLVYSPFAGPCSLSDGPGSSSGGSESLSDRSDTLADVFDIKSMLPSNTLRVEGGGGRDVFTVRKATQGSIELDGEDGGDIYRVAVGNGAQRFVFIEDTGICACTDRILLTATSGDDDITIDPN